jgi:hypothetical protein
MPDGKADGSPARPPLPPGKKDSSRASGGAFRRLADFFSSPDPEKEKRRELKGVARALRKINNKLYNPKSDQALPGLAKLFFEFYKVLGPAQTLLAHAKSSAVLRSILIENGLTQDQAALRERLGEQSIRARLSQGMGQTTVEEIRNDLKTFAAIFDPARARQVNELYRCMAILLALVHFDYFMLLRKFDPALREGDYAGSPRFEAINAQYIEGELKDFLEILPAFDPMEDWSGLWQTLKSYRGAEPVAADAWRKLLSVIRRLKRSGELEMVAQLIAANPFFRPTARTYRDNIVEEYLTKLRAETETTLQKVAKEKRTQSIESLTRQVFGGALVNRLANYTEEANSQFAKKMSAGYAFVAPLSYLHAFLVDFVQKELSGTFEALLVRGKWSDTAMAQMLSGGYHELQTIGESLEQFDGELNPESELGRKLTSIAARADKDRQRAYMARRLMNKVNEQARDLLLRSCQHCVTIGKMLKNVVDDVSRGKPQLVLNWNELVSRGQRSLREQLIAQYKKLYYFVQLLKLYI